jgi:hypothetical protein
MSMKKNENLTGSINIDPLNVDPLNADPLKEEGSKKPNIKGSKKSVKLNANNLINKIKNPSNNFDNKMREIDELVATLDQKYTSLIKSKVKEIIDKYDKLAIKLIEEYELEGSEENVRSKEKADKLEELYNNRDIEILQVKLKYVEMSEKQEEIPEENNELSQLKDTTTQNQEQNSNLYVNCLLHKKIIVPYKKLGNNMSEYFKNYSEKYIEGICHKEGYIRPFSSSVVNFSSGLLKSDKIIFDVVFSVDVCYPYENMELMCKIKNITKIGIRGIISENNNPIVLFISREHNSSVDFDIYEEGQYVKIKVIGNRFEENDKYISVIGEII